jgi:hypothetical protein
VNPTTAIQNAAEHFIRRACRRLPADIRDECCREWAAETWAILNDTTTRPAARRHLAALRYAADHIRGTRHHPHAQNPKRLRVANSTRRRLLVIGLNTVSALSVVTWIAFLFPGVKSAAGGLGDLVAAAFSILVPTVVILARARRRRDADHEPSQES